MAFSDGIVQRLVDTDRLSVNIVERAGDEIGTPEERTVVLLHGLAASSRFWQELMQDLPSDLRVIAVDLRGFGGTEHMPVDATRGVRDFSDDVHATLRALGIGAANLVGWDLGGAVAMQYALDHPVRSLTLEAPISPYGFGGTRRDGSRLTADDAGCGAGAANADFVRRLAEGDRTDAAPTSPRSVLRSAFFASDHRGIPGDPREDAWVEAMLSTSTASGNYPGNSVRSASWPGFAAGDTGVLNALAPRFFDVSGIVQLKRKPPILWVHGDLDTVVSDASFFDSNLLGRLGILPGWPGEEVAPPQEMVAQMRDVLAAYRAAGGEAVERELTDVGHTPHIEQPGTFRRALLEAISYIGHPASPAPPTEAIIISSSD